MTYSITSISGVKRFGRVDEDIVFNKQLSAITGVNTIRNSEVVVVEDMPSPEAVRWAP